MVEKEGTDGAEEAKKAYRAAREDSNQAVERALGDKVYSALRDRVKMIYDFNSHRLSVFSLISLLKVATYLLVEAFSVFRQSTFLLASQFQVDAMLQKLEKEIDDVDATIGDRWRLLDRYGNRL